MTDRRRAIEDFMRAGRESSRMSVMFRHVLAARLGLTVTDMECVDFLIDTGSASAGELAARTNLTTGAITSLIRRLERAGYVTATRDPADRRRVIVTLVAARLDEGRRLYESFGRRMDQVIGDYSTEEIEFLARHYDQMTAVFAEQLERLT